jgi:hypothetical protein
LRRVLAQQELRSERDCGRRAQVIADVGDATRGGEIDSDVRRERAAEGFEALASGCPQLGVGGSVDDLLKSMPDRAKPEAVVENYPSLRFANPVFVGIGSRPYRCFTQISVRHCRAAACRAGSIVETHYHLGQDHGGAVDASLVDSLPFVKKVFAGQAVVGNCATTKAPPAIN